MQHSLGTRNFEAEPLLTEQFMLYTSSECPLSKETAVKLDEAYAYPWIILQEHSYDENCFIMGEDEMCPNSIISFQDKDSVKQAISANLGVAVMASSFAGEHDPYVTAGLIHRVGLTDVTMETMHVLMTPKKRKFTTVEKYFLEELHKFYQKLGNNQKMQ